MEESSAGPVGMDDIRPEGKVTRQQRLESLMELLRGRRPTNAGKPVPVTTSLSVKRLQIDPTDKAVLQKCLDSLQRAIKVMSQQSLVERLEAIARQLSLSSTSLATGTDQLLTITADMFHVQIQFDKGGGVREVKVAHGGEANSCPELVEVLSRRDFSEFTSHLEGLLQIYQIGGDMKVRSKAFLSLQSLEHDLSVLAQLQSSINSVGNYIHKSPLGIMLPRKAGFPMKLIYFVSPYDLLDKKRKSAHPMTVEAIMEHGLGASVTVCLEQGPATMLQTMPLMNVVMREGKQVPSFQGLSHMNSFTFPGATFVLVLHEPIPLSNSLAKKIQSHTNLEIEKASESKPLLSLLLEKHSDGNEELDSKELYVSLPDQQQVYFVAESPDSTLFQSARMVSRIPFSHPMNVALILNYLRHQLIFNTVVASFIRPNAKKDLSSSVVMEISTTSLEQISVMMEHPLDNGIMNIDLDLSDIANVKCRLSSGTSDQLLCTDDYASRVFQRCLSIPITLRSIIKKGREQLQKLLEERLVAMKLALWQRNNRKPQHVPSNPCRSRQTVFVRPVHSHHLLPTALPLPRHHHQHHLPQASMSVEDLLSSPDKISNNPLLATLLDQEAEGAAQDVNDSPMLSKLLEDQSSVCTTGKPTTLHNKRVRKRRSTSEQLGRSPKQRVSDSECSVLEMDQSPFDSNSQSIIDLTDEPFGEFGLKKLDHMLPRQQKSAESELSALLADGESGRNLLSKSTSPSSKNDEASTPLENVLAGSREEIEASYDPKLTHSKLAIIAPDKLESPKFDPVYDACDHSETKYSVKAEPPSSLSDRSGLFEKFEKLQNERVEEPPPLVDSLKIKPSMFDFKSDEDDDDPLPALGSDRLSVYAASPTRLQITSKSFHSFDNPPARKKGDRYKRSKEARYSSSGESVKRKRTKEESRKERKKRKMVEGEEYLSVDKTVYRAAQVESDHKSVAKLKIRVSKETSFKLEDTGVSKKSSKHNQTSGLATALHQSKHSLHAESESNVPVHTSKHSQSVDGDTGGLSSAPLASKYSQLDDSQTGVLSTPSHQSKDSSQSADSQALRPTKSADSQPPANFSTSALRPNKHSSQSTDSQVVGLTSAPRPSKSICQFTDSPAARPLKSTDSHVQRPAKSTDSQAQRAAKSADSHIQRSTKPAESQVQRPTKPTEGQVQRTTKSADVQRSAKSADGQMGAVSATPRQTKHLSQSTDTSIQRSSKSSDSQVLSVASRPDSPSSGASKTDPKLATKTTIRLKPLNISTSSSSVTVNSLSRPHTPVLPTKTPSPAAPRPASTSPSKPAYSLPGKSSSKPQQSSKSPSIPKHPTSLSLSKSSLSNITKSPSSNSPKSSSANKLLTSSSKIPNLTPSNSTRVPTSSSLSKTSVTPKPTNKNTSPARASSLQNVKPHVSTKSSGSPKTVGSSSSKSNTTNKSSNKSSNSFKSSSSSSRLSSSKSQSNSSASKSTSGSSAKSSSSSLSMARFLPDAPTASSVASLPPIPKIAKTSSSHAPTNTSSLTYAHNNSEVGGTATTTHTKNSVISSTAQSGANPQTSVSKSSANVKRASSCSSYKSSKATNEPHSISLDLSSAQSDPSSKNKQAAPRSRKGSLSAVIDKLKKSSSVVQTAVPNHAPKLERERSLIESKSSKSSNKSVGSVNSVKSVKSEPSEKRLARTESGEHKRSLSSSTVNNSVKPVGLSSSKSSVSLGSTRTPTSQGRPPSDSKEKENKKRTQSPLPGNKPGGRKSEHSSVSNETSPLQKYAKLNGESPKDDTFRIQTSVDEGDGLPRKKRVNKVVCSSPVSNASSPENGLVIDCEEVGGEDAGGGHQFKPPTAAPDSERTPVKVSSPKRKINQLPQSGLGGPSGQSMCDIDDDLMDEALMGLNS